MVSTTLLESRWNTVGDATSFAFGNAGRHSAIAAEPLNPRPQSATPSLEECDAVERERELVRREIASVLTVEVRSLAAELQLPPLDEEFADDDETQD